MQSWDTLRTRNSSHITLRLRCCMGDGEERPRLRLPNDRGSPGMFTFGWHLFRLENHEAIWFQYCKPCLSISSFKWSKLSCFLEIGDMVTWHMVHDLHITAGAYGGFRVTQQEPKPTGILAGKPSALVMATNANQSQKLDMLMRRLYAIGAPKAGMKCFNYNKGTKVTTLTHVDTYLSYGWDTANIAIWMNSKLHIIPGPQFLLYSIVLLSVNKDVQLFTEAGTGWSKRKP